MTQTDIERAVRRALGRARGSRHGHGHWVHADVAGGRVTAGTVALVVHVVVDVTERTFVWAEPVGFYSAFGFDLLFKSVIEKCKMIIKMTKISCD